MAKQWEKMTKNQKLDMLRAEVAKIVTADEEANFPKGVPGCNCMHCQICRAVAGQGRAILAA